VYLPSTVAPRPVRTQIPFGNDKQEALLQLQDDGHDERAAVRILLQEALEVAADLVLHHAVVAALFVAGAFKCAGDDVAGIAKQFRIVSGEAAGRDFRRRLPPGLCAC
jgi:hypothetical protein